MTTKPEFKTLRPREIGSQHFRAKTKAESLPSSEARFKLNPAPFIALLSLTFLMLGVAYNIGIFLPLGEKLVLNITLSDHIQTSIYVGLLVVLLPLILLMLLYVAFLLGRIALLFYALFAFVIALLTVPNNHSGRYWLAKSAAETKQTELKIQALTHFQNIAPIFPQLLALVFCALLMLLLNFAIPETLEYKFKGAFTLMFFLLFFAFLILAWTLTVNFEIGESWRQPLRIAMSIVILLVFSFQVGVFDSLRTHKYLLGEAEAQHRINGKAAHIISTFEKGVFVAVPPTGGIDASVRFIPWKEVESTDAKVVLPLKPGKQP